MKCILIALVLLAPALANAHGDRRVIFDLVVDRIGVTSDGSPEIFHDGAYAILIPREATKVSALARGSKVTLACSEEGNGPGPEPRNAMDEWSNDCMLAPRPAAEMLSEEENYSEPIQKTQKELEQAAADYTKAQAQHKKELRCGDEAAVFAGAIQSRDMGLSPQIALQGSGGVAPNVPLATRKRIINQAYFDQRLVALHEYQPGGVAEISYMRSCENDFKGYRSLE